MIDDSIATQVKTIMLATITEFATNERLRQYFVTREELQDLMQGFTKEMFLTQAQQRPEGNPKRKSSKKKYHLSPDQQWQRPSNIDSYT